VGASQRTAEQYVPQNARRKLRSVDCHGLDAGSAASMQRLAVSADAPCSSIDRCVTTGYAPVCRRMVAVVFTVVVENF